MTSILTAVVELFQHDAVVDGDEEGITPISIRLVG